MMPARWWVIPISRAMSNDMPSSTAAGANSLLPNGAAWTLTEAFDINNNGQIVGRGTINGETHAFLMTIPEPGTLLLLGAGVVGMTLARGFERKSGAYNAAMAGSPA